MWDRRAIDNAARRRAAGPLALAAALLLAACSSSLPNYEARTHVVQRGETLYSIAFRYNVDHRALARWNGLDNPNLIHVGQRIRLQPAASRSAAVREPARQPSGAAARQAAARTVEPSRRPPPPPAPRSAAAPAWQWPTDGRVVAVFGSSSGISSGVGIGGRHGQAVTAAAAGRVVYAGTGLIGYGQLIIVQHDDEYLSAYGYNDRVLVAQGDNVARGQKIAEMGLGPQREPRLHFEIRRNGTPVNPLQLVAAR